MAKYRSLPVVIEAVEFNGAFLDALKEFCPGIIIKQDSNGMYAMINTLEGVMTAGIGDFIIKGLRGEFYPCKPDVFHKKYELVEQ